MKFSPLYLLFVLSLTGCEMILSNLPGIYRIDIDQGNMIDQSMVDQLRPNMTKRQVLFIMGSPMLVDFFHQDRWDYIYLSKKGDADPEQKSLSIYFENDQMKVIQGDFKPGAMTAIKPSEDRMVDVPQRDLEKTLVEKISSWFGYDGSHDDEKREVGISKPLPSLPAN